MARGLSKWLVLRLSIVDKKNNEVIGTIELCKRVSEDAYNQMAILRVEVRSDYEKENELTEIFSLILPHIKEMLGCEFALSKGPIYAVERLKALQNIGFSKSNDLLIGKTGYAYANYWTVQL